MLTLWFAPNSCARVTLTALEETGAQFDTRLVAFMAGEHRQPAFLRLNPAGKVPALETGEGVMVQNGAILSWLAETYPDAALLGQPKTAADRARALAELFRCSSDLHPQVTRFVLPQMISTDPAGAPGIRAKAEEGLAFLLAPVAARLEQQEWALGADWTIIDAYLAWIWFRITGSGFDEGRFPAIRDHYARANARPSAQAALVREAAAERDLAERGLLFRAPFQKD